MRNEARRLAALRATEILDTPPAEEFDALVRAVARAMDMPMARVSLIDAERQWLKAAFGTEIGETTRATALCNLTIEQDGVFVVEDLAADPRHAELAASSGAAGSRFYAGVPILAGGRQRIGAVCVMDTRPRRLTPHEIELLEDFAALAGALIRGHKTAKQLPRDRARLARQLSKVGRQEQDLKRRDRMLRQTERMAQLGGWEWDCGKRRLRVSDEIPRLTGTEWRARPAADEILRCFSPGSAKSLRKAIARAERTAQPFDLQVQFSAHGEKRWARVLGEAETQGGLPSRIFGTFQDVTDNRLLHERLRLMAHCDDLTGLAKRAHFTEICETALDNATERGEKIGLLVIDLDHFKHVNDTLGHRAGDEMLKVTAERLRSVAGPRDAVARLGGDEFAVMLRGVSDEQALLEAAHGIVERVSETIHFERERMSPGASVGCSLAPDHGATIDTLMQNADMALYRAKTKGRGGAALFEPEMREAVQQRVAQVASFRTALERGQIVAHYQPQLRLRDNKVSGFEALARWRKADGRVAPPKEFRYALDDADACLRLGATILEQVASDLRIWTEDGFEPGRISVNATSPELMRGDYPERVRQIFEAERVPLERLTVEVTENVFLGTGAGRVETALHALREMGATIALDDFGTGFASLSHLKRYPVDEIKIDRSFIRGLGQCNEDQAIVAAVMHLARSLGIRTTAEGVETTDQIAFLRLMACDGIQGFLLGRPEGAAEVPRFLNSPRPVLTA